MKKLGLGLLFFGLILSQASYADIQKTKPLWDQTDELICSGLSRFECTEAGCSRGESTALWKVNFPNKKITSMGSTEDEYTIGAMHFRHFEGIDATVHTIFLNDGRMLDFNMDNYSLPRGTIDASLVDVYWRDDVEAEISSMLFRCSPQ